MKKSNNNNNNNNNEIHNEMMQEKIDGRLHSKSYAGILVIVGSDLAKEFHSPTPPPATENGNNSTTRGRWCSLDAIGMQRDNFDYLKNEIDKRSNGQDASTAIRYKRHRQSFSDFF